MAFTSAGGGTSKEFAETITKHGCVMIDNSSAFRMDNDVPLVVPECNAEDALNRPRGIIANPNCTTIVSPGGHQRPESGQPPLQSIIASSYQAVSGAGASGPRELMEEVELLREGKPVHPQVFQYQIALQRHPPRSAAKPMRATPLRR